MDIFSGLDQLQYVTSADSQILSLMKDNESLSKREDPPP